MWWLGETGGVTDTWKHGADPDIIWSPLGDDRATLENAVLGRKDGEGRACGEKCATTCPDDWGERSREEANAKSGGGAIGRTAFPSVHVLGSIQLNRTSSPRVDVSARKERRRKERAETAAQEGEMSCPQDVAKELFFLVPFCFF